MSDIDTQGVVNPTPEQTMQPGQEKIKTEDSASQEVVLSAPRKSDRSKPVKFFGLTLPDSLGNTVYNVMDGYYAYRFRMLTLLPEPIVNNSSNFIGATQLVGEALYFKSSGVNQFIKPEHKGTWKAFVYPPINVVEGVFKKASAGFHPRDLLNPKKMGTEIVDFFNLGKSAAKHLQHDQERLWKLYNKEIAVIQNGGANASELHKTLGGILKDVTSKGSDLQHELGQLVEKNAKLSNTWSARSGFSGMLSMTISTLLPEEKDRPEDVERMAIMSQRNPLGYMAHRVGKGLAFTVTAPVRIVQEMFDRKKDHHIGDGKREFAGIGMTMTGFFSVLAGIHQPRQGMVKIEEAGKLVEKVKWKYGLNPWQALGGAITTYAGSQLLFGINNQQGWTNYGGTQLLRLFVLPQSIRERFPDASGFGDPNAKYYFGAQGAFQFKNVVAVTIGGARKQNGHLIEQKKPHEIREDKAEQPPQSQEKEIPKTTLHGGVKAEKAMPERVASMEAAAVQ